MHDKTATPILKYFDLSHLPKQLQDAVAPLTDAAHFLDYTLPNGPEKSEGLRKLLEAKDCFVRAALEKQATTPNPRTPALLTEEDSVADLEGTPRRLPADPVTTL